MEGTWASKELDKRVSNFGASIIGDTGSRALDVFHQPIEIIAGVRDTDDADGRLIPKRTGFELRDRDIERRTQTIFKAACDLTLVLDRVRSFDAQFEGEKSNHEECIR